MVIKAWVIATVCALLLAIGGVGIYMGVNDLEDTHTDDTISTTIATTESIQESETTTSVTEPEETIHTEPTETAAPETEPTSETTEPPVMEETVPEVDPEAWEMLACVIYQEAGGDAHCDECRRRVADVVLNRVADPRFPNTIYEVLTAPNQYGRFHWTGIVWADRHTNPGEAHAVERAYRIAKEVLMGQHSELYGQGYIWQAEFIQGVDNIYHCGHYFGR